MIAPIHCPCRASQLAWKNITKRSLRWDEQLCTCLVSHDDVVLEEEEEEPDGEHVGLEVVGQGDEGQIFRLHGYGPAGLNDYGSATLRCKM